MFINSFSPSNSGISIKIIEVIKEIFDMYIVINLTILYI